MTTQQIIALAKEKFGRDITEKEAQDYVNGKTALPDEVLAVVSGGGACPQNKYKPKCPKCGSADVEFEKQQISFSDSNSANMTVYCKCICHFCGYKFGDEGNF